MKIVIVYESMYGNTHHIADAIGQGFGGHDVRVAPAGEVADGDVAMADLLVVGGPTHIHSMTTAKSREAAVEAAASKGILEVDPDAEGEGLRDWFADLSDHRGKLAAAFDTRLDASPVLTGRASKAIAKRLQRHGFELVLPPKSFLVNKGDRLVDGEHDHARSFGTRLAESLETTQSIL